MGKVKIQINEKTFNGSSFLEYWAKKKNWIITASPAIWKRYINNYQRI
jgi:hypothetical protein